MKKSDYAKLDIEDQWKIWQEQNPDESFKNIVTDELREKLIADLSVVSKMSVAEYTLYQKWCEVQEKYPAEFVNTLFDGPQIMLKDDDQARYIRNVKNNIWVPESVEDYQNLKPVLVHCNKNSELAGMWNAIRVFSSTMKNNNNIGRNMNFIVKDEVTDKFLGVICISSDFLDLTPRDNYIGWSREKKTQGNMINYSAIGSTIVPLQPLGYNYVGGKLLALLCLSDTVQDTWKREYGDTLVSVTTTSLYGKDKAGGLSQYDNLKHWKKMGYSSGSVSYEATKPTISMIREWLKTNHTRKYFEWYAASKPTGQPYKRDHRNRSFTFAYSQLGIDKDLIKSAHQRGIYYSPLYTNTCEFLRGEISEDKLEKSFDTSTDYLVGLWKDKYARKRISSLIKNDRVSSETLFYDDLYKMTWEETKRKYLTQVGR